MRAISSAVVMITVLLYACAASRAESSSREVAQEKTSSEPQEAANTAFHHTNNLNRLASNKPAQGPFKIVHRLDDMVTMIERTTPTGPSINQMELWWWVFLSKPIEDGGVAIFDTMATFYRIDCSQNILQEMKNASYLDGRLVIIDEVSETPKPSITAADRALVKTACDPVTTQTEPILANFSAAQSAVEDHFAKGSGRAAEKVSEKTTISIAEKVSEALNVNGPLHLVPPGTTNALYMIAGPQPEGRPDKTVDRWMWAFLRKVQTAEETQHDSVAMKLRVDCNASTIQNLRREMFLNGDLQKAMTVSSSASKPKNATIGDAVFKFSCDPDYGTAMRRFDDIATARGATTDFFVSPTEKMKLADQQSETKPNRKRLPIRLTDSGYTQSTSFLWMTEGPAPTRKPESPVEAWGWSFWGNPLIVAGKTLMDATATLRRVDCTKETSVDLIVETYADGKLRSTRKPKEAGSPKRALIHVLKAACDPSYKPDAPTFPDYVSARAEAVRILAARRQEMASRKKAISAKSSVAVVDSKPSASGEAERIGSPLRMIALNRKLRAFFMTANAAPTARPIKPVELWVWEFTQKSRRMDGKSSYDTWATRIRIDCNAGLMRPQLREGYKDGVFDASWELTGKARKGARGSLDDAIISAACDPAYKINAQKFVDHRAARAAVLNTKMNLPRK